MTMKATRKQLKDFAKTFNLPLYSVSYGYISFLEDYPGVVEIAYNYGVYGWNWTAYLCEGAIYCCGYRNLIGERKEIETNVK